MMVADESVTSGECRAASLDISVIVSVACAATGFSLLFVFASVPESFAALPAIARRSLDEVALDRLRVSVFVVA